MKKPKNKVLNFEEAMNAPSKVVDCQGLVLKADVGNFITSDGLGFSVRLRTMKKKSCTGCPTCDWQRLDLAEVSNDWPIIGIEEAEHGQLYTLSICDLSLDWESGQADSYNVRLNKYNEEDWTDEAVYNGEIEPCFKGEMSNGS